MKLPPPPVYEVGPILLWLIRDLFEPFKKFGMLIETFRCNVNWKVCEFLLATIFIRLRQCTGDSNDAVCPILQTPFNHNDVVYILKTDTENVRAGREVNQHRLKKTFTLCVVRYLAFPRLD